MSKRTLIVDAIRAERINSVTTNTLSDALYLYMATSVAMAKADTAIPVGALYVNTDNLVVYYKNEQT